MQKRNPERDFFFVGGRIATQWSEAEQVPLGYAATLLAMTGGLLISAPIFHAA
jgi:hypothetical protein